MGRELKRKQAKKEGRNIKEIQTKNKDLNTMKPKTLFIILGVLVLFCVILYFITSIFITKDIKLKEEEIKLNNDELDKVKKDNELKYKNIDNMNTYIDSLEKRVKEYE